MKRFLLLAALCVFAAHAKATTVNFTMDAPYVSQTWTLDILGFVVPPTDPYEMFKMSVNHVGGPTVTHTNDGAYIDNWTRLDIWINGDGGSWMGSYNGCAYTLSHCERGDRTNPLGLWFLAEPQTLTITAREIINNGPLTAYGPLELYITFPDNVILEALPVAAVPEPSTWAMMLIGFALLGYRGVARVQRRPSRVGG